MSILASLQSEGSVRADVLWGSLDSPRCRYYPDVNEAAKLQITTVTTPAEARPGSLSWARRGEVLETWNGSFLITEPGVSFPPLLQGPRVIASCECPRLQWINAVQQFFGHLVDAGQLSISCGARIHPSAVIGATGQGYEWDGECYLEVPHLGGVVIEHDVHIGPNSTIMRGVLGDTFIGRGSRIGNGVNIGHGVRIGRHCLVVAHASIGGSAQLGDHVTIWQGAMIANRVCIGAGAVIGMGAVVLRDVPSGETWVGNPAHVLRK